MKKIKKITVALKILKIEKFGFHLLLKIKINNKTARLIVDTGASQTVLDKNRIHHFVDEKNFLKHNFLSTGLGTNNLEGHIVKINKIEIGDSKNDKQNHVIENVSWMLLDMSHVNQSYSEIGIKEIDGVLGGDILKKCNAVIDYEKKQLNLKIVF